MTDSQNEREEPQLELQDTETVLDLALAALKTHIKYDWTKLENAMGNLTDRTSLPFLREQLLHDLLRINGAVSELILLLFMDCGFSQEQAEANAKVAGKRMTLDDNYTLTDLITPS